MEIPTPSFDDLGLSPVTLASLKRIGFVKPSPIQAAFVPRAITGIDVIGQAQTGTGKTAAFVLPILERIDLASEATQALVLTPTRELSQQVADEAHRLAVTHDVKTVCLVGGRPIRQQIRQLQDGAQIVIGTPGRVIDLLQRGDLRINKLSIVVLDEADRMLDIGFRPDIEKILRQCPADRQTLLLSATLPPPVERLAQRYMRQPERIDIAPQSVSGGSIDQYYLAVDADRKFRALVQILRKEHPQQVIVFTRTKRGAENVFLRFAGRLPRIAFLHGDLAQSARDRTMRRFREGEIRMLIATDVVGRGIDISGISHIINYDIPEDCDDYVHRVGRTGRLSSVETRGAAITLVCQDEGDQLTRIEIRINRELALFRLDGDFEPHRKRPVKVLPPPPPPVVRRVDLEQTEDDFGGMIETL